MKSEGEESKIDISNLPFSSDSGPWLGLGRGSVRAGAGT